MIGIQNGVLKKYIGNEQKIIVPDGVTSIEEFAFGTADNEEIFCPNLEEVVLPESLTEISRFAFYRCESLKKINLPEQLQKLGTEAFGQCKNLEEITIPEGVTEIPYGTFSRCYALRKIHIPETVTEIKEKAFYGCSPEKLVIPEHITSLSPEVFERCANISEMVYQNIHFSAWKFKDRTYINIHDCIKLINEHDISVQIPSPEKEDIVFQLYCQYPDDKELVRFLKEKFPSKFRVLVDRRKTEIVRKILEQEILITKNNINSCIFYSAQQGTAEITLLLTDYKYQHFGYEDIETVVSRKFVL